MTFNSWCFGMLVACAIGVALLPIAFVLLMWQGAVLEWTWNWLVAPYGMAALGWKQSVGIVLVGRVAMSKFGVNSKSSTEDEPFWKSAATLVSEHVIVPLLILALAYFIHVGFMP